MMEDHQIQRWRFVFLLKGTFSLNEALLVHIVKKLVLKLMKYRNSAINSLKETLKL